MVYQENPILIVGWPELMKPVDSLGTAARAMLLPESLMKVRSSLPGSVADHLL